MSDEMYTIENLKEILARWERRKSLLEFRKGENKHDLGVLGVLDEAIPALRAALSASGGEGAK